MIYTSAQSWHAAPAKRIALFGMSGLGKTYISNMLRAGGGWFHYSVDYRIGTRYMGEHIVDNVKREAMRVPFLRDLLMTDSIYIASNITFENLSPLSTYLGKPGDPAKGGIAFEDYILRQRQHRAAEIAATLDALDFAGKAQAIYGYPHFICDTSGSICEVVDPDDPRDPVLSALAASILLVWIEGTEAHTEALARALRPRAQADVLSGGLPARHLGGLPGRGRRRRGCGGSRCFHPLGVPPVAGPPPAGLSGHSAALGCDGRRR